MNRYEERPAQLKHPDVRPGDVVLVNGQKKLVTAVTCSLVKLGHGRGNTRYESIYSVERVIVRNLKLKPGVSFCGMVGV